MRTADYIPSRFNLYKSKYCILVGAGISVCAGIPLATKDLPGLPSIVTHVRRDFYNSLGNSPISNEKLLSWYDDQKLLQRPETIYSDALNLIGDTPRSRQHYLRRFFEGIKPGACHKLIAKLIEIGHLEIIFTTNFDPLLEDAIRENENCLAPKIAAHSESVTDIKITESGPKIIKLHGDYLFSNIKNTAEETEQLTKNMREKLRSVLAEKGLVVLGYSGNDNSIISIFEQIAFDGGFFPYGLYWLHRSNSNPNGRVKDLIKKMGGKLIAIDDAETFLSELLGRLEVIK